MKLASYLTLAAGLVLTAVAAAQDNAASPRPAELDALAAEGEIESVRTALGTAFTYQGRLTDGGSPATGTYDFQFILYDSDVGGSQVPGTSVLEIGDVSVSAGLFSAKIDFGPSAFRSDQRWLDVAVRPGASVGLYTPVIPRHELTPTAAALYATNAGGFSVPFSGSLTSNSTALALSNFGNGGGIIASTTGSGAALAALADGSGDAVLATTGFNGTGMAGNFVNQVATNSSPTLRVFNTGLGPAGSFQIGNASNASHALSATTSGSGNAVRGNNSGTGRAGYFEITNGGNTANAVEGRTDGSGDAVLANNTGTGRAGYFEITNSGNTANAIEARTDGSGDAIRAVNAGSGLAARFEGGVVADGLSVHNATDSGSAAIFGNTNELNSLFTVLITHINEDSEALRVTGQAVFENQVIAGYLLAGNLDVSGTLTKGGGSFKIDHPLDPANKFLYHSFVESPDMMNVYNGNVALDVSGEATVTLRVWPSFLASGGFSCLPVL